MYVHIQCSYQRFGFPFVWLSDLEWVFILFSTEAHHLMAVFKFFSKAIMMKRSSDDKEDQSSFDNADDCLPGFI